MVSTRSQTNPKPEIEQSPNPRQASLRSQRPSPSSSAPASPPTANMGRKRTPKRKAMDSESDEEGVLVIETPKRRRVEKKSETNGSSSKKHKNTTSAKTKNKTERDSTESADDDTDEDSIVESYEDSDADLDENFPGFSDDKSDAGSNDEPNEDSGDGSVTIDGMVIRPANDEHRVEVDNLISKKEEVRTRTALITDLPIEVLQLIYGYVNDDFQIVKLGYTCRTLYSALTPSFWFQKSRVTFDENPLECITINADVEHAELHQLRLAHALSEYKARATMKKTAIKFDDRHFGNTSRSIRIGRQFFATLLGLVKESDASLKETAAGQIVVGNNFKWLTEFFKLTSNPEKSLFRGTDLLDNVVTAPGNRASSALTHSSIKVKASYKEMITFEVLVKLCCVHFMLHPSIPTPMKRFIVSQSEVYQTVQKRPIFKGVNKNVVDLIWLQHVAHFFKFHFKADNGAGLLQNVYKDLPETELPRGWTGRLKQGTQNLAGRWKGAFTYIADEEDLEEVRSGNNQDQVDEISEERNGFQDMRIVDNLEGHDMLKFQDYYYDERLKLDSLPKTPYKEQGTKKEVHVSHADFFSVGQAEVDYPVHGRVHALPDQYGVPGWQRVSMVKLLPARDGGGYGPDKTEKWCYEGVVLPGNQIMMGRWWDPLFDAATEQPSTGPWIFWRVSDHPDDKMGDNTEAIKFLEDVESQPGFEGWY